MLTELPSEQKRERARRHQHHRGRPEGSGGLARAETVCVRAILVCIDAMGLMQHGLEVGDQSLVHRAGWRAARYWYVGLIAMLCAEGSDSLAAAAPARELFLHVSMQLCLFALLDGTRSIDIQRLMHELRLLSSALRASELANVS